MIKLIGAAIDQCAGISGAIDTPQLIADRLVPPLQLESIIRYTSDGKDIDALSNYFTQLAILVKDTLISGVLPVVVGGDHSCAIGTWSGVAAYFASRGQTLGLIWIDAHMDAHTPETTLSGNLHGMPLAVLLGHGYTSLVNILTNNPKLKPENVVLIGIRSHEEDEMLLLQQLGVKVYYNYDVAKEGFTHIFTKAWDDLSLRVDKIGMSIDVDGFDPEFTPGVGTAEPDGLDFDHFIEELAKINIAQLAAVEITEANISLDNEDKTLNCVLEIIYQINQLVNKI